MPGADLSLIVAILLGLVVVVGIAGVVWRVKRRGGRFWALLALQPVFAALLWLTLFPPRLAGEAGALIVATRNARNIEAQLGARVIALPEAPAIAEAERFPDLATALRRYPELSRVVVVGEGLEPRDRDAVRGLSVRFTPPAGARGLIRLSPPQDVAVGALFRIGGQVAGADGGSVELIDPAGRKVDARPVGADGRFVVRGAVRAEGPSTVPLRILDKDRKVIETAPVEVMARQGPAARVIVLSGAPNAEVRHLRRWATDAGIDMRASSPLGNGIEVGDAAVAINASTLADTDLVIVDDRAWAALPEGERAAIRAAVRQGMGLLLRPTGPLDDATRGQWAGFGFPLSGSGDAVTVTLPPLALDAEGELARRGPGTRDTPVVVPQEKPEALTLTAVALTVGSAESAALLPDQPEVPGRWRLSGRGRVGVLPVTDSYTLVLTGHGDRHADLWSQVVSVLARSQATADGQFEILPRAGQRMRLCGLADGAEVLSPDGGVATPLADEAGCGAYWPRVSGWHVLRQVEGATPFHVLATDALPGVRATETAEATLRLVSDQATTAVGGEGRRGASWPWALGWLLCAALLWWLERRRA